MKNAAIKIEYKTEALKATQLRQTARQYRTDSDQEGVTKEERKALRKLANKLLEEANDGRWDRRHLHLAYCYLKGRTYRQCEAKCDPENKPSASTIASIVNRYKEVTGKAETEITLGHLQFWLQTGDLTRWQIEASYHQKKAVENADKARQDARSKLERVQGDLARYERQKGDYERRIRELDTHRIPQAQKEIEQAEAASGAAEKAYQSVLADLKEAQREPEFPLGQNQEVAA